MRGKKRNAKHGKRRVRIGAPGPTVTGMAGLVAVDEMTARLGLVAELNAGIGPIKQHARRLTGGQLLVGIASAQLLGQDCLARLDRVRADVGSVLLSEAPVAPIPTAEKARGLLRPAAAPRRRWLIRRHPRVRRRRSRG